MEILTIDEMQEMASDGVAAMEKSKEAGARKEVGRAAAGIIASEWIMVSQLAARVDRLAEAQHSQAGDQLAVLQGILGAVEGLRADTAAFREEVLRRWTQERAEEPGECKKPAPARPGVIQPDPRDPARDAGYDASGSGGAPKPPAGGREGG
jgi:hypothetical protein